MVMVSNNPRRIVSLVPSLTETIASFGLSAQLVGITSFCVRPKGLSAKIIGGTKNPDLNLIKELRPTHIFANKEENQKPDVTALREFAPVLLTDTKSVTEVSGMITEMCAFLDIEPHDTTILDDHAEKTWEGPLKKSVYLIWSNPFMAAGNDTYISSCLPYLGYENLINEARYPEVDLSRFKGQDISILLSSEPYPFRIRDAKKIRETVGPVPEISKIDGRVMSWYGSSTLDLFAMKGSDSLVKKIDC
jgi:ABC-type Fe3+-hydroxamate transport system substrate-binding protein